MVSVDESRSNSANFSTTRPNDYTPPSSPIINRQPGRSMRTIRSHLYRSHQSPSPPPSENLTDSIVVGEVAPKSPPDFSHPFSDFSAYSSDISGELHRLATPKTPSLTRLPEDHHSSPDNNITDTISPEDLLPTVNLCIAGLNSVSVAVKRSAAAKLRLLAKNSAENRALIGESGAVPALIQLLHSSDTWTQEHAVTAVLNLSLLEENKALITAAGAIRPLIYVLKTGTETSRQNAACALLNLSFVEENKALIGANGAIPALVELLRSGSCRGKKDAITTLYKVCCSVEENKEKAVEAGAVRLLVEMVEEEGGGMTVKAMVVLSVLAGVESGRREIVEEGGIAALVEVIEDDGSIKGKEFAVGTLLQLCCQSVRNRGLLVREGAIPPLVAFSQCASASAKQKAETLLGYLREPRQEVSGSSP